LDAVSRLVTSRRTRKTTLWKTKVIGKSRKRESLFKMKTWTSYMIW
jgi:hypothetical protein